MASQQNIEDIIEQNYEYIRRIDEKQKILDEYASRIDEELKILDEYAGRQEKKKWWFIFEFHSVYTILQIL